MRILRMLAVALLAAGVHGAHAQFWDQGFTQPKFKADYNSNVVTTDASCWAPAGIACPPAQYLGTTLTFPASNYFELGSPGSSFWTTHFNVEPWWKSLSGPPGQSMAPGIPGQDVFGFSVQTQSLPGESFYRAHLVLRHDLITAADHANVPPQPPGTPFRGTTPFMGFGAVRGYGGGNIGSLNAPNGFYGAPYNSVEFTSSIWNANAVSSPNQTFHYMYFWSHWSGRDRMVFVRLWDRGRGFELTPATSPGSLLDANVDWAWVTQQSYFNPGADLAFVTINSLRDHCPQAVLGHDDPLVWVPGAPIPTDERVYRFNLRQMMICVSNAGGFSTPFPASQYYGPHIDGVQWSVESGSVDVGEDGTPAGPLWIVVHGMRMFKH